MVKLRKNPPKKIGTGYKLFMLKENKLYPPMVANPDASSTPVGVWIDASAAPRAADSKTGRPRVRGGGKGTHSGSVTLAYRPGWHLGEIPYAPQFHNKQGRLPDCFVWALCEYAADIDYQEEAESYGYNKNGKFIHSYAGLPKIPVDGCYRYRTNPNPNTPEWIISGAIKVLRILKNEEVEMLLSSRKD